MKIRIFQPIVPEYRVALFNGVGKRYGTDVEIWSSEGIGEDISYPLESMRYDYNHPFVKLGPIRWQRGLSLKGLSKGDVIVICGDVHQISSLWIAVKAKWCGIGVVWWGHHKTATSRKVGVGIRLAIAKVLGDVFLCYTHTGVLYLERHGFKSGNVFATGNTIDQAPIKHAILEFNANPIPNSTHSLYFLCCGVLRRKVCLDLFIKAMADPRLDRVQLVVIGDGPMKGSWCRLAATLGVENRITWIPGTRNQKKMVQWFLGAKAFIYPGSIGLGILHSFSYGLPVITHGNGQHQMPEFEAMEDGRTGVCFRENDLEDLITCCHRYLSNENNRLEMGQYCQKVAFSRYSIDQMVSNFCAAIEAVKGISDG